MAALRSRVGYFPRLSPSFTVSYPKSQRTYLQRRFFIDELPLERPRRAYLPSATRGLREYRRNSDIRDYHVSCDKIRARLGFRCHITLDEGIDEIYGALSDGLVSDYTLPLYHNHKYLAKKKPGRASSLVVVKPATLGSPAGGSAARGAASGTS